MNVSSHPLACLAQRGLDAAGWVALARSQHAAGARLLSLWGSAEPELHIWVCWVHAGASPEVPARLELGELILGPEQVHYPALDAWFAPAARMQRGLRDLLGAVALGGDTRPWLRHDAWGKEEFPLRAPMARSAGAATPEPYAFVPVEGEGVHVIGVGPVHAGIIEPGQFHFSVVGEKVLRLEQRLGFCHKGVEALFRGRAPQQGVRLAARLSGDSACANAWAYCRALEGLAGVEVPGRALALRALLLERERLANHLGDIGAICNDTGLGFGQAQCSRLKEQLLRVNAQVWGTRWPMDAVCPGGVTVDLSPAGVEQLDAQHAALQDEVLVLRGILAQHEGLRDRLRGTGRVEPELAQRLGLLGLAGRASGQVLDLRCHTEPYAGLGLRVASQRGGDVEARFELRFDEVLESLRLCRELLRALPAGAVRAALPHVIPAGVGLGVTEGWRGPVMFAVHVDEAGCIARCHPHDVSWQNWPALEWAAARDIVADFPLINKSFNLSYSGHDV